MKNLLKILMLMSLVFMVSCGSDDDDDNDDIVNEQIPQEEEVRSFSTRLSNTLLVAGVRCEGSETVELNGTTYTCNRNEWLVTIDDVNTCTDGGACTEIGVPPFIAELDRDDRIAIPEYTYFEIDPKSPVTPSQDRVTDQVHVRFDLNSDEATVVNQE